MFIDIKGLIVKLGTMFGWFVAVELVQRTSQRKRKQKQKKKHKQQADKQIINIKKNEKRRAFSPVLHSTI